MSTHIPFHVLVGWNKDHEPQKEDGKAKLKISGCNSSYQDAVGIGGATEFEWKNS